MKCSLFAGLEGDAGKIFTLQPFLFVTEPCFLIFKGNYTPGGLHSSTGRANWLHNAASGLAIIGCLW